MVNKIDYRRVTIASCLSIGTVFFGAFLFAILGSAFQAPIASVYVGVLVTSLVVPMIFFLGIIRLVFRRLSSVIISVICVIANLAYQYWAIQDGTRSIQVVGSSVITRYSNPAMLGGFSGAQTLVIPFLASVIGVIVFIFILHRGSASRS